MKQILIFYLFPEATIYDELMEQIAKGKTTITRAEYSPLLENLQGELYALEDFIRAFNSEIISDQGLIFHIVKS